MEQQELIDRIAAVSTLSEIESVKEMVKTYIASHSKKENAPIYYAVKHLFMMEEPLRIIEEAGIPMDEFYRLRDKRNEELMTGDTLTPWPEDWAPVLKNT